jgi:hypothetical protein
MVDPATCYHCLKRSDLDYIGFAYLSSCIKRSDTWKRQKVGDRTQCFEFFMPDSSRKIYGPVLLRCIVNKSDAPRRLTFT